jgi:hypothetical protein
MCWHIGESEPPRGAGSVFDASPPPSMRDTTRQDPEQPPERHCRPNVARDVWLHPDHQTLLPFIGLLSHSFLVIRGHSSQRVSWGAFSQALSLKGIFAVRRPPIFPTLFHGVWGAWIRPHGIITNTLVSRQANVRSKAPAGNQSTALSRQSPRAAL